MEIACRNYNRRDATHIKRYHLYLRVISLYDLLTYDGSQIHPELARGSRVSSRASTIHWVDFPKPPKKDAQLWITFLTTYIKPYIESKSIQWNQYSSPNYQTIFCHSTNTDKLYQFSAQGVLQFEPKITRRWTGHCTFHKNYIEIIPTDILRESFINVEVTFQSNDIQILCESKINTHRPQLLQSNINSDIQSLHSHLPISLQRLCGSI
jgi:hypothetical protein